MADGFLGRWAKRKEAVRQGEAVPAEPVKGVDALQPSPQPSPASGKGSLEAPSPSRGEGRGEGQRDEPPPPPTLADAESLTPASDFRRYVQPDVAPEVRNAAMKKLWADPHFNVMDGLDIYIGDYGKPDPIPPEWLRQLASAKFLNLFEEKEEEEGAADEVTDKGPAVREAADAGPVETVAQSSTPTEHALPPAEDHADPDLRLQQDDAPGPEGPGAGSR
ncbi:DUF3306 domain-containing protein [Ramlibacter sp. PS3R-8]|uniref:DUF3306 domain-containing protein n=1 Tax=Ramlibacter sp. PS3R-8 TaxID=3133437 RepID=UPI0030A4633F